MKRSTILLLKWDKNIIELNIHTATEDRRIKVANQSLTTSAKSIQEHAAQCHWTAHGNRIAPLLMYYIRHSI